MTDDTREMGIEFGDLSRTLREEVEYPMDHGKLIETYGDRELEVAETTVTVRELLEPLGEERFESTDEVEQAILSMVGDEAIGRKNYSDRTPYAPGEEREKEGAPGEEIDDKNESF